MEVKIPKLKRRFENQGAAGWGDAARGRVVGSCHGGPWKVWGWRGKLDLGSA